jgi:hypothetical protein
MVQIVSGNSSSVKGTGHGQHPVHGNTSQDPDGFASRKVLTVLGVPADGAETIEFWIEAYLTEQLIDEAFQVQQRFLAIKGGQGKPDFSSVLENPLRDAESSEYRLVTAPRLGLARVAFAAAEV